MMICDRIRELIPECLAGRLDAKARERVIDHLDTCSACRAEMAELGVVYRGLESMSEPEPSEAMRTRFLETLKAYQEGFEDAQRRQALAIPQRSWWAGFLPARPAWQAAFSAILLLAGAFGGRYLATSRSAEPSIGEMAQLKTQVESLRQLVTLSLLREESPSSRLRGVNYSYLMTQPDDQVEQALLRTVNHDSNVNVRLSAIDALAKYSGRREVRRALIDSLPMQDSPLVQVALIDLLMQANAREATAAIRKIAQDEQTNDAVKVRAAAALAKLEGSR